MENAACIFWWVTDFLPPGIQEEDYSMAYETFWDADNSLVTLEYSCIM